VNKDYHWGIYVSMHSEYLILLEIPNTTWRSRVFRNCVLDRINEQKAKRLIVIQTYNDLHQAEILETDQQNEKETLLVSLFGTRFMHFDVTSFAVAGPRVWNSLPAIL